ncbi:MAG: hypothetical protein IJW82_00570 [Clostridia bacterium]|nr:hypothetical protein [Clostridia bacterium]
MKNNEYKEYNYVKNNSFEKVTINLSFKNIESKPLVKIGASLKKGDIIAGGENRPKIFAPFDCKVKDFKKISTGENLVSSHIELEREINDFPMENITLTKVITPLDFLKKIEEQGVIDCQENCDIYEELSQKIEKIQNLVINFYDLRKHDFTRKYLFLNKKEEIVKCLNFLNDIFNFKKITIILDYQNYDIINEYKSVLENKFKNLSFMIVKNNFDYNTRLKFRLLSPVLSTKFLSSLKTLYFDGKTFFDVYTACINNQKITSTYFTISGDAINNQGIYKMPIGISIKEIIELAETKNTYDYVDNYVYNAMEAFNDEMIFEKEIEQETDEIKKQKLQKLLEEKTIEANEKIYSKRMETLDYYNKCLGIVFEIKGDKNLEVFSQFNVVTPSTSAIVMLTRETIKKSKLK